MADIKGLQKRLSALKEERSSWEPLWKDIRDYILPDSGCFDGEDATQGGKRYQRLYDAEAADCVDIIAAGILGGVSSPSRPWLRLTTMDLELDEEPAVKQWLADTQDRMLMQFAKSEVYNSLHRSYLELPTYGTSCTIIQRHPQSCIDVQNLTIGDYWLADNAYGRVDTMYRKLSMTAKQMVQHFGYDRCSNAVQSAVQENPFKRFNVIHAIEPRLERDIMKHDSINKPFASIYFEETARDGQVLSESGFDDFPVLAPRWLTTASSVYGRGPGAKALSASKSLQRLQQRLGTLADYLSDPPVQYPAKYRGMLNHFRPGGRIPVDPTESDAIRSAWEVKTDPTIIQALIQARKQEIQRYFYVNIFQMIAASASQTQRTATEVAALEQEKVMMMGPVLERLHTELLDPLVTTTFNFMLERGLISQPPEELHGKQINVEYISVLAEAQRSSDVNSILNVVQEIGTIAQFDPSALDKLNIDETIDLLADKTGVPPSMIVAGPEVAMIRSQRAKQEQAAAMMQQAQAGASALKDLSSAAGGPDQLQQSMSAIQDSADAADGGVSPV